MKIKDAETRIIQEWDTWVDEHSTATSVPDGGAGEFFFEHLSRERRELLRFQYTGDKWQRVRGWLRRHRRVTD
jgi:hypothetical protein